MSFFGLGASAQLITDFETEAKIKSIGIYDCWEESPFRTGQLKGNCRIVDNPLKGADEVTGKIHNSSKKVLGAQRSIYGSNMFGVRIDLAQPIKLAGWYQFFHINVLSPVSSKLMLVGLGRRMDWGDQPGDVEQFWEPCWSEVYPNSWCDAVFRVYTADDIEIHSIILIPQCESPHNLDEGFLFYVDNISLNTSQTPLITPPQRYVTAVDKSVQITDAGSYLSSIDVESPAGTQTIRVDQQNSRAIYKYVEDAAVYARPGERITVRPNYKGEKMHAYLYLDSQNNGNFEVPYSISTTSSANKDLVAYSYHNGLNSAGDTVSADSIALPAFTVPQDLAPGAYRMRLKLDWYSHKPEGSTSNSKFRASGSYTDFMLFVADSVARVSDQQLNGRVLGEHGESMNNATVPAFTPLTVKLSPAEGFKCSGLKVTSGFNINSNTNKDRHGNVQYLTREFELDSEYFTIPAEYLIGNVLIEGRMVEDRGDSNGDSGVNDIAAGNQQELQITTTKQGVTLRASKPVDITICDLSGTILHSLPAFTGEQHITLLPGIYLINNRKVSL